MKPDRRRLQRLGLCLKASMRTAAMRARSPEWMHLGRLFVVVVLVAAMPGVGEALAKQEDALDHRTRFRTAVVRGAVEVVVERDGEFVEGLSAADFEVRVNDESCPVRGVELVVERALRNGSCRSDSPQAGQAAPQTVRPEPSDGRYRMLLLLIDRSGLGERFVEGLKNRGRLVDAVREFVDQALGGPVDDVAIYTLDPAGSLHLELPPSHEREVIHETLDDLREAPPWEPLYGFPNRQIRMLSALGRLVETLGRHAPGSALAIVAHQFDIMGDQEGRLEPPTQAGDGVVQLPSVGDPITVDSRLAPHLSRFLVLARRAAVGVYPIIPTLLADRRRISVEDSSLVDIDTLDGLDSDLRSDQSDENSVTGLYWFASATGGKVYRHLPDLEEVLQDVARDFTCYYLVTYEPVSPEPGDVVPEVEVLASDVSVRYRLHLSRERAPE